MDEEQIFILNAGASIQPFDGGGRSASYCVSLGKRNFYLNSAAVALLERFRSPSSISKVLAEYVNQESLRTIIEERFIREQLLLSAHTNADISDYSSDKLNAKRQNGGYIFFRIPFLSETVVARISKRCSRLYSQSWSMALVSFLLATHVVAFILYRSHLASIVHYLSPIQWVETIILVYLSLLAHEFGHASACAKFGEPHGPIGIAIYGIYPVFYSDVSRAWRLRRSERVCVDIGGMYFQGIMSSVCLILWWLFRWPPALACSYSIVISSLLNLNPFFRFDGYWIFVDAIGVPRPLHDGQLALRRLGRRMLRFTDKTQARNDHLFVTNLCLVGYTIAFYSFLIWTIYFLAAKEIPYLYGADLALWHAAVSIQRQYVSMMQITDLISHSLGTLLTSVIVATGLSLMLMSNARRLISKWQSRFINE